MKRLIARLTSAFVVAIFPSIARAQHITQNISSVVIIANNALQENNVTVDCPGSINGSNNPSQVGPVDIDAYSVAEGVKDMNQHIDYMDRPVFNKIDYTPEERDQIGERIHLANQYNMAGIAAYGACDFRYAAVFEGLENNQLAVVQGILDHAYNRDSNSEIAGAATKLIFHFGMPETNSDALNDFSDALSDSMSNQMTQWGNQVFDTQNNWKLPNDPYSNYLNNGQSH